MFAKVKDDTVALFPYGPEQLAAENPFTMFTQSTLVDNFEGTDQWQAGFRLAEVVRAEEPAHNPRTETVCLNEQPDFVDGMCVQGWTVRTLDADEQAARDAEQWSVIRADRNKRLLDCDWTQLADCPLTNTKQTEWSIYRQALRDVTTQADPFAIAWPVKPE